MRFSFFLIENRALFSARPLLPRGVRGAYCPGRRFRVSAGAREVGRRRFRVSVVPREVGRCLFRCGMRPREVSRRSFWVEIVLTVVFPPCFRREIAPLWSPRCLFGVEKTPSGVFSPFSCRKCRLGGSVPLFRRLFPLHRCFSGSVSERKRRA